MAGRCHSYTRHGLIPEIARRGYVSEVYPPRVWRVGGVTEIILVLEGPVGPPVVRASQNATEHFANAIDRFHLDTHSVTGPSDPGTHCVTCHFDFLCEGTAHAKRDTGRSGSGLVPRRSRVPRYRPPLPMRSAVGSRSVPPLAYSRHGCGKAGVCLARDYTGPAAGVISSDPGADGARL